MRVVVENSIQRVKQWRILKNVYRHWRNGKGRIEVDNVVTVVVALTNRKYTWVTARPYSTKAPLMPALKLYHLYLIITEEYTHARPFEKHARPSID